MSGSMAPLSSQSTAKDLLSMSTSSRDGGDFGFFSVRKDRTVRSTASWPKTAHASDIGSIKLRFDFMAMEWVEIESSKRVLCSDDQR
jgi:hypothetical protein